MKLIIFFLTIVLLILFLKFKSKELTKRNARKFSLVYIVTSVVLIYFFIPAIPLKGYSQSLDIHKQMGKFSDISTVQIYSPEDKFQEDITRYTNNSVRDDLPMFLTYIFLDQNIKIKNTQWLIYEARSDLNIMLLEPKSKEKNTTILATSFNGVDYFAKFKKTKNDTYMTYIIKGTFKPS